MTVAENLRREGQHPLGEMFCPLVNNDPRVGLQEEILTAFDNCTPESGRRFADRAATLLALMEEIETRQEDFQEVLFVDVSVLKGIFAGRSQLVLNAQEEERKLRRNPSGVVKPDAPGLYIGPLAILFELGILPVDTGETQRPRVVLLSDTETSRQVEVSALLLSQPVARETADAWTAMKERTTQLRQLKTLEGGSFNQKAEEFFLALQQPITTDALQVVQELRDVRDRLRVPWLEAIETYRKENPA